MFNRTIFKWHAMTATNLDGNINHWAERIDLAAAFRWTARLNMHEAVANHFSLAINEDGTRFLMNPNQMHFARIKASDLIIVDANDPDTLSGRNAPDATAWRRHAPALSTRALRHACALYSCHGFGHTRRQPPSANRPKLCCVLQPLCNRRSLWGAGV